MYTVWEGCELLDWGMRSSDVSLNPEPEDSGNVQLFQLSGGDYYVRSTTVGSNENIQLHYYGRPRKTTDPTSYRKPLHFLIIEMGVLPCHHSMIHNTYSISYVPLLKRQEIDGPCRMFSVY